MRSLLQLTLLAFSIILYSLNSVNAQTATLAWQKCIGGSNYEEAQSIIKTTDNNYIVLGSTVSTDGDMGASHGSTDVYVAKISPTGNILWKKSYGGSAPDQASSIQQTKDNGYIVSVISTSSDGDITGSHGAYDAWIIKLDASGNIQWQKSYGGTNFDFALSIKQTFEGGYIFAGWSTSTDGDVTTNKGGEDCWVVKLDPNGNIEWQKTYGGSKEDHFTTIIQAPDSNFIAAGSVKSNDSDVVGHHGSDDYWLVKLDKLNGNIIWKKALGGTKEDHPGDHSIAGTIAQTFDGGFVVSGWSNSKDGDVTGNHGEYDAWIVKINANGNLVWQKSMGGKKDDEALCLLQMPDSSIIAGGITNSPNLNLSGDSVDYDMWVFKLDKNGNQVWEDAFGGTNKEIAFAIDKSIDTSVILAGYCTSNGGQVSGFKGGTYDIWVVKLDIPKPPVTNVFSTTGISMSIAPNPTKGVVNVYGTTAALRLDLYNSMGQLVKRVNDSQLIFTELPTGIYLLNIFDSKNNLLKQEKLLKE